MTGTGRLRAPFRGSWGRWLGDHRFPLKVTAVYTACALLILALTDRYVHPYYPAYLDDSVYIACTAVILYFIIRRGATALRAKEFALRESEDRLSRILETNAGGIVVFDAKGVITFANHAAAKVLGVDRSLLIGLRQDDPVWELTDADGEAMRPGELPLARVRETRSPVYDVQVGVRHRNGTSAFLSVNAAPLLDPSNEMVGIVASFTDITARKKVEDQKLRKLLLAVEQSSSAIAITDFEGIVEYANRRYATMDGCTARELLAGGMLHPCWIPAANLEELRSAARSGIAWHGEFMCRRKIGEAYWESTTVTPIRTAEGEVTNLLWVREDITARKQAEEEIRRSEAKYKAAQEKFRQLFEQNEEPLFLFRQGTCEILDANPAAVHLYGYDLQELLRGGVSAFVAPKGVKEFCSAVAAVRPGASLSFDRANHVRKDGKRIVVSVRANSVRIGDEEVVYASFRDITDRIQLEEEAKLRQAQLIHANRMTSLGTIVSGVAHEVNNPNNLIMFNAPMILAAWEEALPVLDAHLRENGDFRVGGLPYSEMRAVVPRLAAGISDASARIKAIVANLKDYARHEEPRRAAPVDVNDVVRTAVSILNHEILKATHRFEIDCGEGLPQVNGSAQQLEQVVINLVNNALQALTSNSQAIKVSTRKIPDTGEVEMEVADEGTGMSPEVLARVAEPFFSTRTDSGGLGLGLSICRLIVEGHGGSLSFESGVGKGTRALVRLPAAATGAETAAAAMSLRGG